MRSKHNPAKLQNGDQQWIRNNADEIVAIVPEPGHKWTFDDDDTPDYSEYGDFFAKARFHNVIDAVDKDRKFRVYKTDRISYREAEKIVENRENCLPCGHAGIVTVSTDPYRYKCKMDDSFCDQVFGREAAKASLD